MADSETAPALTGFVPLSGLLAAVGSDALASYRFRLAGEHRHKLAQAYRTAVATGKRELAFLLAEALAARREPLPPCFRLNDMRRADDMTPDQRFDLLAHDLLWIRAMYPEHWRKASGSYGNLLHRNGDSWLKQAEHLWATKHQAKTWVLVRQLGLSIDQQWECNVLRGLPVKRSAQGLRYRRVTVRKAIVAHLPDAMRRRGEGEARHTLDRRYRVWVCGEMTEHSPTKAARLHEFWTGTPIARAVAARDLEWVHSHVPEARARRHALEGKCEMAEQMQ